MPQKRFAMSPGGCVWPDGLACQAGLAEADRDRVRRRTPLATKAHGRSDQPRERPRGPRPWRRSRLSNRGADRPSVVGDRRARAPEGFAGTKPPSEGHKRRGQPVRCRPIPKREFRRPRSYAASRCGGAVGSGPRTVGVRMSIVVLSSAGVIVAVALSMVTGWVERPEWDDPSSAGDRGRARGPLGPCRRHRDRAQPEPVSAR